MAETKPYRPSNGTEGEIFQSQFCERCEKDRYESRPCLILGRIMALNINEPGYPKEWVRDVGVEWPGNPRCTAFVERGTAIHPVPTTIRDKRQLNLLDSVSHKEMPR